MPESTGHVDVMEAIEPQLLMAPVEFFGPRRFVGRTSGQNVGLQVPNGVPQDLTILGPAQVFEKGIGADNVSPHGLFANIGSCFPC